MSLVALCLTGVLALGAAVESASGESLSAKLGEAEAAVSDAGDAVEEAEARLASAEARHAAVAPRAASADRKARAARAEVQEVEAQVSESQERAAARVAELEAAHQQEIDDRDQQVAAGIGFGLAALVVSAVALGWSRFRTSTVVRRLGELDAARAIGLCVSGGLVLLVAGGAMIGGGIAVASLGTFIALLGIALPLCLLMARHSVRAERGGGTASPDGEPPPKWVRTAIAAVEVIGSDPYGLDADGDGLGCE